MVRILVTGSQGFVGLHLCRELEEHGHEVVRTDVKRGSDIWADLSVRDEAARVIRQTEPDYVVHLAARYGRLLCRDEPHLAVQDNTAATTELAAVCAAHSLPVLYASSSEVYGDHGTDTITEESELRTPTTIYGLSKRWGEEVLNLYLEPWNLLIVRMNMLYGPHQLGGYGRCSLATFIENAKRGESFTVHRGTTRSWLYIADAVRALRLLIDGNRHGIFNLGNPHPAIPMQEVADMVVEEVGGSYNLEEPPSNQIAHKNYDTTKLLATIDWKPEVGLREGIRQTAGKEVPVA